MGLILLLYTLFASTFTLGKLLSGSTSPIFLTAIRMLLGGSILSVYQYIYGKQAKKFQWADLGLFAQVMICGVYCNYILRFWALAYLPSSKACFLFNFSPFLSSLYSYLLFNERLTHNQWVGLAIGFIGMIPMLISSSPGEQITSSGWLISLPEIAILLSVAMHSYSWIIVRRLVKHKEYDPTFINSTTMSVGGILALITALSIENIPPVQDTTSFLGGLLFVVLVSNVFCHNLYGHLLKTYTATFLAFASFLTPLFAAVLGSLFLHEIITWHFYVSVVVVFAGLYLFYKDELESMRQERLAKKTIIA